MSYFRDDPDVHLAEIAAALALDGPGVGLMTGVDVTQRVARSDGGVEAVATVGLGAPAWAAAPDGDLRRSDQERQAGHDQFVVRVPVRLSDAALVNAVATVAEAKAQALWEIGIDATGTASDATCVVCAAGRAGRAVRRAAVDLGRPDRPSRARGRPRRRRRRGPTAGTAWSDGTEERRPRP